LLVKAGTELGKCPGGCPSNAVQWFRWDALFGLSDMGQIRVVVALFRI
jgi:hypothetical protein